MRPTTALFAATAILVAPAITLAQPAPGSISPSATTGQPGLECPEEAGDPGTRPGHAETAPGSAFNPDGTAGTKYAGEQPQNSKNTASVSQYDTGCFGGSPRPQ